MFKVSFKCRNDIDKVSRKISICNFASNKTCTYHVILRFKSICSRIKRKKDIFLKNQTKIYAKLTFLFTVGRKGLYFCLFYSFVCSFWFNVFFVFRNKNHQRVISLSVFILKIRKRVMFLWLRKQRKFVRNFPSQFWRNYSSYTILINMYMCQ